MIQPFFVLPLHSEARHWWCTLPPPPKKYFKTASAFSTNQVMMLGSSFAALRFFCNLYETTYSRTYFCFTPTPLRNDSRTLRKIPRHALAVDVPRSAFNRELHISVVTNDSLLPVEFTKLLTVLPLISPPSLLFSLLSVFFFVSEICSF